MISTQYSVRKILIRLHPLAIAGVSISIIFALNVVLDGAGIQDLTALQMEVKGQCEDFKVILQPYAIYIPGQILVETPVKKIFRVSL